MCGILGIVGQHGSHVNQLLYDGLTVLQHRGQAPGGKGAWLRFEQGYAIDQPSEILVELELDAGAVSGVRVAGFATTRSARDIDALEREEP